MPERTTFLRVVWEDHGDDSEPDWGYHLRMGEVDCTQAVPIGLTTYTLPQCMVMVGHAPCFGVLVNGQCEDHPSPARRLQELPSEDDGSPESVHSGGNARDIASGSTP